MLFLLKQSNIGSLLDCKAAVDLAKEVGAEVRGLAPFGLGLVYAVPAGAAEQVEALGFVPFN